MWVTVYDVLLLFRVSSFIPIPYGSQKPQRPWAYTPLPLHSILLLILSQTTNPIYITQEK